MNARVPFLLAFRNWSFKVNVVVNNWLVLFQTTRKPCWVDCIPNLCSLTLFFSISWMAWCWFTTLFPKAWLPFTCQYHVNDVPCMQDTGLSPPSQILLQLNSVWAAHERASDLHGQALLLNAVIGRPLLYQLACLALYSGLLLKEQHWRTWRTHCCNIFCPTYSGFMSCFPSSYGAIAVCWPLNNLKFYPLL